MRSMNLAIASSVAWAWSSC